MEQQTNTFPDMFELYRKQTKGKRIMVRDLVQLGVNNRCYSANAIEDFLKVNRDSEKTMCLTTDLTVILKAQVNKVKEHILILQPLDIRMNNATLQVNFPEVKYDKSALSTKDIARWYNVSQTFLLWF